MQQRRAILTLVRHGETSANVEGVWHGSIDSPLTARGLEQAERVAGYLLETAHDAVALYSSPLRRARCTAELIGGALGLELCIEADLREYELGSWEGKSYSELHHQHRLWEQILRDPDFADHGGESPRQVATRFGQVLRSIAEAHPGQRVIVVAHGGALSLVLAELLYGDYTRWKRVVDNCAVSELVMDPEPALLSFNHTDHLEGI
jgi:broad specificity phosphatase PhoE